MSENPSGAIHPTIFLLFWALVGFGLSWLYPVEFVPDSLQRPLEVATLLPGVILWGWGMLELWRHGTTLEHRHPTTALVTSGPYRFSRHPLYLGLLLVMIGLSISYESLWSLLLVVPAAIAIHRLTVAPEEEYLEREFGDDYRRYRSSVRRWL